MIWDMSPVKIYVSHNLFVLYIIPRQKDVTSCKQSKWLLQAIKMTTLLLPWKEFKSSQRITKFHLNQTTIFKFHQLQWFNNKLFEIEKATYWTKGDQYNTRDMLVLSNLDDFYSYYQSNQNIAKIRWLFECRR